MVFKTATFHGLEPQAEIDDPNHAGLEVAVSEALAVSGGLDASDIFVVAEGTDIVLRGRVGTTEEIERATAVAMGVDGVHAVTNQILLG